MNLSDDDVRHLFFLACEAVSWRKRRGVECLNWMTELANRQSLTGFLSPRGHGGSESCCVQPLLDGDLLLGSREVADQLGLSTRTVRRLAAELGGETIGGRLVFTASAVTEYAERRRSGNR